MKTCDLPVGSRLYFGAYGVYNDKPHRIKWIKSTKDGLWICENVIDHLSFDESATNGGTTDFSLSNLCSFLNSDSENWFSQERPDSKVPIDSRYAQHFGFLYYFEDYELSALAPQTIERQGQSCSVLVRVPFREELDNTSGLELFRRRGIRAHESEEIRRMKCLYVNPFSDYWTATRSEDELGETYVNVFTKSSNFDVAYPGERHGVRPVCRINGDVEVLSEPDAQGETAWRIKPIECDVYGPNTFSDNELKELLGLA